MLGAAAEIAGVAVVAVAGVVVVVVVVDLRDDSQELCDQPHHQDPHVSWRRVKRMNAKGADVGGRRVVAVVVVVVAIVEICIVEDIVVVVVAVVAVVGRVVQLSQRGSLM